jgi:hypothetical protein
MIGRATGHRAIRIRMLLSAAVATAIALGAPGAARADVTADCDFLEILAKSGPKPAIDGELKPLEKKLIKPPFATWNQFQLLAHSHKALAKRKAEPIGLKNGSATATLVEIVDKSKVRLTVTMDDAHGKQLANNTATIEAGDYVIYAHTLASNEAHLLAVTCR